MAKSHEGRTVSASELIDAVDQAGEFAEAGLRDLANKLRRQINQVDLTEDQVESLSKAIKANNAKPEPPADEPTEPPAEPPAD